MSWVPRVAMSLLALGVCLTAGRAAEQNFGRLPDEGIIAWQLHEGKGMEVTFKDIQFRNLSGRGTDVGLP
jgi:hypothetical protein